jgi:hypothetical protein
MLQRPDRSDRRAAWQRRYWERQREGSMGARPRSAGALVDLLIVGRAGLASGPRGRPRHLAAMLADLAKR